MKRRIKYFVDNSFWVSLLDTRIENHVFNRSKYEELVRDGGVFFTSNINIGFAFDNLRQNVSKEIAEQFYHFVLRSYTLGELKIIWVGKKYSKDSINLILSLLQKNLNLDILWASNIAICKNKRIKYILSDRENTTINEISGINLI